MSGGPALDRVQRWMLSVITDPGGIAAGIAADSAQQQIPVAVEEIEQVIPRSKACTSVERLAVYGNAYFGRLMECLQAEFRILARAAGEEAFQSLAAGYLLAHPSSSYTLGRLGAKFPQYLEETRPARANADPDWADFLIDLARLERTYSEIFDGPGEEGLPPLDVTTLQSIPPDQWGNLRLQVTQSLRLLNLRFPAHEAYAAIRQGAPFTPQDPREVALAVYRRNYIVQRQEVTLQQATLLSALQTGAALEAALGELVRNHALEPSAMAGELGRWFETWSASGLIASIGQGPFGSA